MTKIRYPHTGRKKHSVGAAFWEKCYRDDDAFWDRGAPAPGLVDFLEKEKYKAGSILVPGCGRGHDCQKLARHKFKVTGVDIAPKAVAEARALAKAKGVPVTYRLGDFLKTTRRGFDLVFEHTCFCAIDPALRDRYVKSLVKVLKPGGHYLAVFYNIQPRTGPPFGTTRAELLERFGPHFTLLKEHVPRSFPGREGKELLMLWKKEMIERQFGCGHRLGSWTTAIPAD